ncbi:hypothetical protein CVT26_005282 [Gymnopilus dilepis]|uniref:F-box domain-containing protein n=1 Tax=Gymnopilus dilepis TaxID=231916 RepID=A0A409YSS3_9AGAR|nr:hypothetical protein CVT26_005282 [Gymnopilus dilepis]
MSTNRSLSLTLPAELKCRIADFSPPSTLAALARTHPTYQKEAEEALYRTLSINTHHDKDLKCLETLAKSEGKAQLVRRLIVECGRRRVLENEAAMSHIINALPVMRAVLDLRVRMRPEEAWKWTYPLNQLLSDGHRALETLYCNDDLDIAKIIEGNPSLKILGIYANSDPDKILNTFENRIQANQDRPIVYTLQRESFYPRFDHLTLFPAFYSTDQITTAHLDLARSIGEDRGTDMSVNVDEVTQLSVYLENGTQTARTIMEDVSSVFSQVTWLNVHVRQPFDVLQSSQGIKDIPLLFPALTELNLRRLNTAYDTTDNSREARLKLVQEWSVTCHDLISVTFADGETVLREDNVAEWV